jgi:hypothetical protein
MAGTIRSLTGLVDGNHDLFFNTSLVKLTVFAS